MGKLSDRFAKEAASFDRIARERARNKQIPDVRRNFTNEYFYNNMWRNSVFFNEDTVPVRDYFIKSLKKCRENSVIELGSGNGWFSLELAREGFDVIGLDISPESIKTARKYFSSLKEKKKLSLKYVCRNIVDYREYAGQSVVCFGFLHHLPPAVLDKVMKYLYENMHNGCLFIANEPRYEHSKYVTAFLIYALRLILPNHFKYKKDIYRNSLRNVREIFEELSEAKKTQSEMDTASSSDLIIKTIRKYFGNVELTYHTAFFDKIIGSIRVAEKDIKDLSRLMKQLDELILKYNYDFSRVVTIKAIKIPRKRKVRNSDFHPAFYPEHIR